MRKGYQYLYYLWYKLFLRINAQDIPQWNALLVLSVAVCIYLQAVFIIIDSYFKILPKGNLTNLLAVVLYALVVLVNHYLLVSKGAYLSIRNRFDSQAKKSNGWDYAFAILFGLGCVPFFALFLMYIVPLMHA
jgi:divalent metal cation (Fe/Co/Zn/Cd) transporter